MPAIEFFIFSGLVLLTAFLSVAVRPMLYSVFFQIQSVVAVGGVLAGLNAQFISFALVSMSTASLLVFLIFTLIVFDFYNIREIVPPKAARVSLLFFVMIGIETVWLFLRPNWATNKTPADYPQFGGFLYDHYGACVIVFGVLLLACMVGITSLLIENTKEVVHEN